MPLLSLVDTTVIGHTGQTKDLGAIALGTLIFGFVYWSFGFLRMGTTGFVAKADGAQDEMEIRASFGRALLIASTLGFALCLFQWPILVLSLHIFGASDDVEAITQSYFLTRIWGAPASLALFAIMGVLVGLRQTGKLLIVQLTLNGLNIFLDVWFAGIMGWGVRGVALGTAMAEWTSLGIAAYLVYQLLSSRLPIDQRFWSRQHLLNRKKIAETLHANIDIMLRTLFLLLGFAWFTDQSARFSDHILAANYLLLQIISFSAYFLDGFAHVTESLAGQAAGARNIEQFDRSVHHAGVLAFATALLLGSLIYQLGWLAILGLTDITEVQNMAREYLPYTAIYVSLSFAAFQLDGIFIGTTRTKQMRNASIASTLCFIAACWILVNLWQNDGLWVAFIMFVVIRALTLAGYYPGLRSSIVKYT